MVVNPAAAGGRVGRRLAKIERMVGRHVGPCDVRVSREVGGGAALAEDAVRSGATTVLSLGGDGTHSEVVNGILRAQATDGAVRLGVLAVGTGSDFGRMLESGGSLEASARALGRAREELVDVGSIRFVGESGDDEERYFLNIASCGVSGIVDRIVNRSSKRLGGTLTFFLAALTALRRYRPARVRLTVDGRIEGELMLNTIAVCNGRYAGGGMMFAPDARLADGQLDVVAIEHAPLASTVALSPRIYRGTHVRSPLVRCFRGRVVRIDPLSDEPVLVDIDGEAPGAAPAELRVHAAALRLLNPRVDCL